MGISCDDLFPSAASDEEKKKMDEQVSFDSGHLLIWILSFW